MAEYIEREALEKWLLTEMASLDSDADWQCVVERLRKEITAADVRPVVRGKWISGDARNVTAVCSNCGRLRLGNGAESATKYAPFCEKCGAYMRGVDNG